MAQNPVSAALEPVGLLLSAIEQQPEVRQILAEHGAGRVSIAEGAGLYVRALAAHARFCAYSFYPALQRELSLLRYPADTPASLAATHAVAPMLTAAGHVLAMPAASESAPLARALGSPTAACRPSTAVEVIVHTPSAPPSGVRELEERLRTQLSKVNCTLARLRTQTADMEELTKVQIEQTEAIQRWTDARLQQRATLHAISNWMDEFASTVREVFKTRPEIIRELGLEAYEVGMLDRFCQVLDEDLAFYQAYEDYMAAAGLDYEDELGEEDAGGEGASAAGGMGDDPLSDLL